MDVPRALTVAGSDSGGGAGIQADLKVFTVLEVFGMSVVTAITAQNTKEVTAVHNVPVEIVSAQFDAVMTDIGTDAMKTGMLSTPEIVEAVAWKVRQYGIVNVVVDPVMVSKSGARLLEPAAVEALRKALLPLALVVTPNLPEAEALTDMKIDSPERMREAARKILGLGPRSVVVKGGHLAADRYFPGRCVDLFYDGRDFVELSGPRHFTKDTHGTGCSFSAAIAAELAKGVCLREAVERAKRFIGTAVKNGLRLGDGHGPTNPWAGALELREGREHEGSAG